MSHSFAMANLTGPFCPCPFDSDLEKLTEESKRALFSPDDEYGWVPTKHSFDTSISSCHTIRPGLDLPWTKTWATLSAPVEEIWRIVTCFDRRKIWQDRFGTFEILNVYDPSTLNVSFLAPLPWPMSPRSFNTAGRVVYMAPHGSPEGTVPNSFLSVGGSVVSDQVPEDKDSVRGFVHMNSIYLTPNLEDPSKTDIIWIVANDPKGSIPRALLKTATTFCVEMIHNMIHRVLTKPEVKNEICAHFDESWPKFMALIKKDADSEQLGTTDADVDAIDSGITLAEEAK